MTLNLKALHEPIGPLSRTYTWKDAVLYALGVGAGFEELHYCYEKELKVLPTFAMPSIMDFFWEVGLRAEVNPAGVLHGEQELIVHHPIPTEGTLTTTGRITHFYDKGKGKGALVVAESDTTHDSGKRLFTSIITIFSRLDGGFDGENSPPRNVPFPENPPDITAPALPASSQPLLYRLSGDLFPLHVDPEFAQMAGFEKPIMHGLCTLGYATRALIASLIPKSPERVRRIACRFSKPLYPGIPIETRIWKTGGDTAIWKTVNPQSGETVIDQGVFSYDA